MGLGGEARQLQAGACALQALRAHQGRDALRDAVDLVPVVGLHVLHPAGEDRGRDGHGRDLEHQLAPGWEEETGVAADGEGAVPREVAEVGRMGHEEQVEADRRHPRPHSLDPGLVLRYRKRQLLRHRSARQRAQVITPLHGPVRSLCPCRWAARQRMRLAWRRPPELAKARRRHEASFAAKAPRKRWVMKANCRATTIVGSRRGPCQVSLPGVLTMPGATDSTLRRVEHARGPRTFVGERRQRRRRVRRVYLIGADVRAGRRTRIVARAGAMSFKERQVWRERQGSYLRRRRGPAFPFTRDRSPRRAACRVPERGPRAPVRRSEPQHPVPVLQACSSWQVATVSRSSGNRDARS